MFDVVLHHLIVVGGAREPLMNYFIIAVSLRFDTSSYRFSRLFVFVTLQETKIAITAINANPASRIGAM